MKSLTETLNETLENSLQLEIARLVDEQTGEEQEETEEMALIESKNIETFFHKYGK